MKIFNKMYYLVLALAVVFTLNNCSNDQISPQNEEEISTMDDMFAKKNSPSASGQGSYFVYYGGIEYNRKFSFHSNTMPDGSVKGNGVLTFTGGEEKIMFDIDCMIIEDNKATMTGVITKSKYTPEWEDWYCWFMVVDNGEGSNAEADAMTKFFLWPAEFGTDCNLYDDPIFEIESGNIQVKP